MTGQPGRSATAPWPGRGGPSASTGLVLALVAALLTTGCMDLATDPLGSEALEVTASDVEPDDGSGPETRWHTDLRRGTLPNQTDAADRHRLEVPDGTHTLRLGLQSNDGNLTACVQDPDAQRDDGQGWCSSTMETLGGKATWETSDPQVGTWEVTLERQPGETGNLTYALTIRHELDEDAPPPRSAREEQGSDPAPPADRSPSDEEDQVTPPRGPEDPIPHVIVGIPDSGINPYHEVFHRPSLTQHPCTYIEGFPCDVQRLPLSVGEHESYDAAVEADAEVWDHVEPGTVYWIPQTNIVAAACEAGNRWDSCILDTDGHGTGTASSVISENPDALLAIQQGTDRTDHLDQAGIPIDIRSVSWSHLVPFPGPEGTCLTQGITPIYVTSAGNEPESTLLDCRNGGPTVISVGGAYAEDEGEEAIASKQPDIVSYFCRPTAKQGTLDGYRENQCGTSFSTPTAAGALSKALLGVRRSTGYTGSLADGMADPEAGLGIADLRDAMNRTASYDPEPKYPDHHGAVGVPLNPAAPWLQWGWGFYDGNVADATLAHLLGIAEAPEKPDEAQAYMGTQHTARQTLYG